MKVGDSVCDLADRMMHLVLFVEFSEQIYGCMAVISCASVHPVVVCFQGVFTKFASTMCRLSSRRSLDLFLLPPCLSSFSLLLVSLSHTPCCTEVQVYFFSSQEPCSKRPLDKLEGQGLLHRF